MATPTQLVFGSRNIDAMINQSRLSYLPDKQTLPSKPWEYGIDLEYLRGLRSMLDNKWSWEILDKKLNGFNHFIAPIIDGSGEFELHFIHEKSTIPDAIPLLMIHGWPSSCYEFHKVIHKLTNPPEGKKAFHVIVPSLPGYLASTYPQREGWTIIDTARTFNHLMVNILGYGKYVVHGGDWGAYISRIMGAKYPGHVIFIHVVAALPPRTLNADAGDIELSQYEKEGLSRMKAYQEKETGYVSIQSTKPYTVGYAIGASVISVLAYIGEKFYTWSDMERLDPWDIVNTSALYYLSGCCASAAVMYYESINLVSEVDTNPEWKVRSKFGYTHYQHEITICPKSLLSEYCENLDYHAEHTIGGHFPALDVPELFVADLQSCFGHVTTTG